MGDEVLRALLNAMQTGEPFTRPTGAPVPATTIRLALLGETSPSLTVRQTLASIPPDPRGLALNGITIDGRLDLQRCGVSVPLLLDNCRLPDGVILRDGVFRMVELESCDLGQPVDNSPNLDAAGATIEHNLSLRRCFIRSTSSTAAVSLAGSTVGSDLDLTGSRVYSTRGPAIAAAGAIVKGRVKIEDARMGGAGDAGTLRLAGATIGGQLDISRTWIRNRTGPAVAAGGLSADRNIEIVDSVVMGDDASMSGQDCVAPNGHRVTRKLVQSAGTDVTSTA